ncbi:MAG: response regulator transcription factor, partial [Verrucomicrobiota bacterium]
DGYAVCKELRRRGQTQPILMLTARSQVEDRVAGLDGGTDDYLVKPFSMQELLARVRALLRRQEKETAAPDRITIGQTRIDFRKQTAVRAGQPIEFSAREFNMLRLLASSEGEPVSRERFLDELWGYNAMPSTRTVDNFILALRGKLEDRPDAPQHILTVRGVGYRLKL